MSTDFDLEDLARRLAAAMARIVPYAESRAEDLSEARDAGREDPAYPGAAEAWSAVRQAQSLLAECGDYRLLADDNEPAASAETMSM